jgi:pimeloyl-ACP methyl ester carboxylesterase
MVDFLSPAIRQAAQALTESTSLDLFTQLQWQPVPLGDHLIQSSYVQQGKGDRPIVLLHGFDSSVMEFRRLLPLLAEQQETWAIDLLGFGFGGRLAEIDYSPQQITAHLHSFWQQSIQRPMILVGASMGGAAAIDFTLQHPEAVAGLVLIDSAGLQQPPKIGRFMVPPLDRWVTNFLRSPRVRQNISKTAYFDPRYASEDARLCAALHLECDRWSEALITFTKNGGYGNYGDQLGQIQCPTTILWGRGDRILGIKNAAEFQRRIPNSQLNWLEDCGHVPHLESPARSAAAILRLHCSPN